ncbi:MAG: hypothetical protein LQ341_007174, partial [Variospora aurantia]
NPLIRELNLEFDISDWPKIVNLTSRITAYIGSFRDLIFSLQLRASQISPNSVDRECTNFHPILYENITNLVQKTKAQRQFLCDLLYISHDQVKLIMQHVSAHENEFEMDLLFMPGKRIRFRHDRAEHSQAEIAFDKMVVALLGRKIPATESG